jgi:hypothetical protein
MIVEMMIKVITIIVFKVEEFNIFKWKKVKLQKKN